MHQTPPANPTLVSTRLARALAPLIFIAAFIPFLPALNAGLVAFDDTTLLQGVDGYRGLGPANFRWMFSTTLLGHYQPLTWVSYALDYQLWGGLNPRGFHFTNLLFHALNASLVFFLARQLIAAAWNRLPSDAPASRWLDITAAAAALLFAIHPLRVESVAWITERRDVLSTFFLLLSAITYLRAFPPRSQRPASIGAYTASIALLLVSLLCKAWGMTFVVIVLVLDWYPLGRLPGAPWNWLRPPTRAVLIQKLPYAALGLAAAITANYAVQSIPFTAIGFDQWPLSSRLVQSAYGLMFYLEKMAAPIHLAALYQLPIHQSLAQPRFIAGVIFAIVLVLAAMLSIRRFPAFTAAAAVYAVMLAPVLGVRQSGPQLVADRYTYLANISWAILLTAGVAAWARRRAVAPAPLLAAAAAVLTILGALSWRQTLTWHDTDSLFANCLRAGSDGAVIRLQYGRNLAAEGHTAEAIDQLRRATELDPAYGEAWFALAQTLRDSRQFEQAEQCFLTARTFMADPWRADLMRGTMYIADLDPPRPADAAAAFQAAIKNVESPGMPNFSPRPYLMMAAALDYLGDVAGERRYLLKAAEYPETRTEALQHLKDLDAEPGAK